MNQALQMNTQPQYLAAHLALAATISLMFFFAPTAALATPPATVASCAGIKDAYPNLGTQCAAQYANVDHAPANATARRVTFEARRAVMVIFRQAALCNGIHGASTDAQRSFLSGEAGHLEALENLRRSMVNRGDNPLPEEFDIKKLGEIAINDNTCN